MKVTFNFKKSTCRLNWVKILKVVFGFNLKEAKACDATVRAIVEDALGRKVILVGKHAFEWSIILEKEGRLVITTFLNREQAVDTFNKKYRNK